MFRSEAGQLNCTVNKYPRESPPLSVSAESQMHAACIFSQAFLWKLGENWQGINSRYTLLCKQAVDIQNLKEDAGMQQWSWLCLTVWVLAWIHYTPCQHASAVHDGLLLCFYWKLSLSHFVFQSFIPSSWHNSPQCPPGTRPTEGLCSRDAFPRGHSWWAQRPLCPRIRKLWEVCGG